MTLALTVGIPALVAGVSWWRALLTPSGAVAAWVAGAVVYTFGGARSFLPLLGFFLAVNLVKKLARRWFAGRIEAGWEPPEAKSGARDHFQVAANAGVATALVLAAVVLPAHADLLYGAFLGSLCANSADTFASEVGVYATRPPRLLWNLRPVARGLSGGVTALGYAAAGFGGLVPIACAALAGGPATPAAWLGGFACGWFGSSVDSVVGATLQEKRRCRVCGRPLERAVHCDTPTEPVSGFGFVTNDLVNVIGALSGASLGAWVLA